MDKYRKLSEILKQHAINAINTIPLLNAEVVAVDGESCTVKIDDVDIEDVRIKATINGESNKVLLQPKIGSIVLIGSLTGDLKDLAVLKCDEIEKMQYEQDGLTILVDSTDGKVKIENSSVSLKDVFQQLADLLKQLKVFTPMGPSGTPLPDTISAITQFETSFKQILK